jgi:hypothetical protein
MSFLYYLPGFNCNSLRAKVFSMKKHIALFLLSFYILTVPVGCVKMRFTAAPENEAGRFKNDAEIKSYLNKRLTGYATILASLARNAEVRKAVNEGVAKKFDGDYNVLIKDLYTATMPAGMQ